MTLAITRPAPFADLCAMIEREGLGYDAAFFARLQTVGKSWGWSWQGHTIACAGLMERPDGLLEAWFACRPEAANHMVAVRRAAQLTLRHAAHDRIVVTRIGSQAGERLAASLGFTPSGEEGGDRLWTWRA